MDENNRNEENTSWQTRPAEGTEPAREADGTPSAPGQYNAPSPQRTFDGGYPPETGWSSGAHQPSADGNQTTDWNHGGDAQRPSAGEPGSGWYSQPRPSVDPYRTQDGRWSQDPFSYGGGTGGRQTPPKRKKRSGVGKIVALCLVCALIGAAIQPAARLLTSKGSDTITLTTGERTVTEVATIPANTDKEMTPAEIYAAYVNSTVGITVDIVTTNIFGQSVTGAAAGSGFVISEDGYILTNYHVISQANAITVAFVDGKTYPATLVGGEEANDIAIIKIEATGLTPVVLGASSNMRVGEPVTAIGNPLGELTFTETQGIISALNRTITMSDGRKMNMIQTDCAINSGNSGGPLFNNHGEVIGIVSAKYSSGNYSSAASVEGLGFAIPMDDVAGMVKDLVEKGYVTGKPYLGLIMGQNGVDAAAQAYGVPAGVPVLGVTPGLAAQSGGVQGGDIITKIDGKEITSSNELTETIRAKKPGDEIVMTIYRNGETLDLNVTLGEATAEAEEATQKLSDEITQKRQQEQQEQQQQQQQNGGNYYWPFGNFGFGF